MGVSLLSCPPVAPWARHTLPGQQRAGRDDLTGPCDLMPSELREADPQRIRTHGAGWGVPAFRAATVK